MVGLDTWCLSLYNPLQIWTTLCNVDSLSRLQVTTHEDKQPGYLIHLVNHLATTNVKAVRDWTSKDPLLSRVHHFLMVGWPESIDTANLKTYHKLVNELSVSDGCILRGSRVVIPPQGQKSVLVEELIWHILAVER